MYNDFTTFDLGGNQSLWGEKNRLNQLNDFFLNIALFLYATATNKKNSFLSLKKKKKKKKKKKIAEKNTYKN